MTQSKFDLLIPVGPAAREVERLKDLLDALFHYEHEAQPGILVVNDGNSDVLLRQVLAAYKPAFAAIIDNPRNGQGDPWCDGMAVGVLAGLSHLAAARPSTRFIMKLDTDSLVINSFCDAIVSFFDRNPHTGLIGTYLYEPGHKKKTNTLEVWEFNVKKLLRYFGRWRRERSANLQIALWGRSRRVRRIVKRARSYGYPLGASCIGGGYAISREALQKMQEAGVLTDPCLFLNRFLTEDVVVGLLVSSIGLGLADFNLPGEPFGVVWQGLCARPKELLELGYAIIHSIKDFENVREAEVREFFARVRASSPTTTSPAR